MVFPTRFPPRPAVAVAVVNVGALDAVVPVPVPVVVLVVVVVVAEGAEVEAGGTRDIDSDNAAKICTTIIAAVMPELGGVVDVGRPGPVLVVLPTLLLAPLPVPLVRPLLLLLLLLLLL